MAVSKSRMKTEITCQSWDTLDVFPWVVVLDAEYGAMSVGQRAWFIDVYWAYIYFRGTGKDFMIV